MISVDSLRDHSFISPPAAIETIERKGTEEMNTGHRMSKKRKVSAYLREAHYTLDPVDHVNPVKQLFALK